MRAGVAGAEATDPERAEATVRGVKAPARATARPMEAAKARRTAAAAVETWMAAMVAVARGFGPQSGTRSSMSTTWWSRTPWPTATG